MSSSCTTTQSLLSVIIVMGYYGDLEDKDSDVKVRYRLRQFYIGCDTKVVNYIIDEKRN